MTKRERVLAALDFREPDKVPYNIGVTQGLHGPLAAHFGTDDLATAFGNHVIGVSARQGGKSVEVAPGKTRDSFGVVWDRTVDPDIGTPCDWPLREPTLSGYAFPEPVGPSASQAFEAFFAKDRDAFTLANLGFSLFERAWTMRGMSDLLMDMVINEAFADELFDAICDWNMQVIAKAVQYPFDAIMFGDDWGSQRGLLMGPTLWRRYVRPRIARMYGAVRASGKKVLIHSCGDVDELFDDLVECGLNCFNPFQPEVMDTFALAKKYKGRLAFFGGISTQKLLPYGTPDEVRAGVKDILKRIGAGGGYIAAPAHEIPRDTPPENVLALYETLRDQ